MQPEKIVNGDQLSVNGGYTVHPFDKTKGYDAAIADALAGKLINQGIYSRKDVEACMTAAKIGAFRAFKKGLKGFIGMVRFPTETDKFFEKLVADGVLKGEEFADDAEMQEVTNEEIERLRNGLSWVYHYAKTGNNQEAVIYLLEELLGGATISNEPPAATSPLPPSKGGEAAGASYLTAVGES